MAEYRPVTRSITLSRFSLLMKTSCRGLLLPPAWTFFSAESKNTHCPSASCSSSLMRDGGLGRVAQELHRGQELGARLGDLGAGGGASTGSMDAR